MDASELQQWTGRRESATDSLHPFPARALAAALDAEHVPGDGDGLPPTWHWLYFLPTPTASGTGPDGHPHKGGFLPPVPFPRRMWAAGSLQVEQPLRLGKPAQRESEILAITPKSGRSGEMVFVDVEHRLSQDGTLCLREVQNLVYRAAPDGPAPLPAGKPAPEDPALSEALPVDPVLLFRYSALTYNGHRIHYDRDYATGVEFYPALVVHGPLLATRLAGLAQATRPDAVLSQFEFRAIRPSFDTDKLWMEAKNEGDDLVLWTRDAVGNTGMQARASFS